MNLFLLLDTGEFCMNSDEEKGIVCLPGLGSDKHNSNAPGERGDLESQAASKSGNEQTLDAKQLLAAIPKTKEELFAYDIEWAICDKVKKNYPYF
jgi:RNA-binding protein 25